MMTRLRKQNGLTLVEIMIAMTLGLVLLAGVVQIFTSSRQSYRLQEALSEVQENGRFGVELIARDLRMTNFAGCVPLDRIDPATNLPLVRNNLPAGPLPTPGPNYSAIQGTEGGAAPDQFTVDGARGPSLPVLGNGGSAATPLISANNGLSIGDLVLISDCTRGDITQVTGLQDIGGNQTQATLNPAPGATYGLDAKLYSQMVRTVYSIQQGADGNNALFRTVNGGPRQELVAGVEDMQVLYGVDTDGDNTANQYLNAANVGGVNNWRSVVSMRVSLLIRSSRGNVTTSPQSYTYNGVERTAPDHNLYRVFTTTVAIRNNMTV